MKIDNLRRRTVRALIQQLGMSPPEAGKEYARHTDEYNRASDYSWPSETWEDAEANIVNTYWSLH